MLNNRMKLISVVSIDEIDADDKNSHSYYLVEFTSSPYNIQNIYIYLWSSFRVWKDS